jgi:hypothetical protein
MFGVEYLGQGEKLQVVSCLVCGWAKTRQVAPQGRVRVIERTWSKGVLA